MSLIDTHTHLESFAARGELASVLARARGAGVEEMITIGTSPEDWNLYRGLATEHEAFVHYSVGLHPCSVDREWEAAVRQIENFWAEARGSRGLPAGEAITVPLARPVALGECGLDRFHLPKDAAAAEEIFGWQCAAFAAQLDLAKKLGCPVVVHSRGAFRECIAMIDASGVAWDRVVFHCFTEGVDDMAELTRRGGFGSFTGIVTYKTADNVREAAKAQGLERLMIETDAPYLTPMPHRGKTNEPSFLAHTAEFCARAVFGVELEQLAEVSTANARTFFGI